MLSIKYGIMHRMRKRRKEAKLSQLELAQKAGVSFGSLRPSAKEGVKSATLFG